MGLKTLRGSCRGPIFTPVHESQASHGMFSLLHVARVGEIPVFSLCVFISCPSCSPPTTQGHTAVKQLMAALATSLFTVKVGASSVLTELHQAPAVRPLSLLCFITSGVFNYRHWAASVTEE